ncbi:hypothetical protein FF1_002561 [Malus domestica]|uniref:UPF0496 protein At1g20180-like n=1 Tax=Malus domestica TaxID=3750 RepID=UPI0010AA77E9|nr:UPF0496 protein At1g20180-like [Malus domestica]
MWAKLRASSNIAKGKEVIRQVRKSFNLNEEYLSAFRTKSYADFFNKAQLLVNESSSSPLNYNHDHKLTEVLLEPGQEAIPDILDSAILSKEPKLKGLMLNYFDISAEASKICSHLLKSINHVQSSYHFVQQELDKFEEYSPDKIKSIISELNLLILQNNINPFSNPNNHDFELIHEKYSSVLHHLKSMRKKVSRKIKRIKCFKKATGICITAACSLIAITAIVLAAHTLTALLMGPALISFPFKSFKKKPRSIPFLRSRILTKVGEQLDVAAKGIYILNRDFDTMSRLVARLHDEVEHNKAMIRFCLERREDKFSLQVVKELKKTDVGFRKQVEELQEHVYLCLVTINRARALVVKEMTKSCAEN